ncbi:MAG: hypothetical protein ABIJ09_08690 [Pseudomonadota bacterium]
MNTKAGSNLKESKARGWEIDARGRVKIVEPFTTDPPDEYFIMRSEKNQVMEIQEVKKRPELATCGFLQYDAKKHVVASVWKERKGIVVTSFYYSYDERGTMTRREERTKTGRVLYTTECRCDDSGNLLEERYLKGEEFLGRNEYTYDAQSRIASETHFDNEDKCSGSYHFKYDEKGRCISRAWHNLEGKLMTTFSYTLDDKGNRIRAELLKAGQIENVQEFTYDARGNLLEERWKDADGTLLRTIPHRAAD